MYKQWNIYKSKYELKITYEFISSEAAVDNWNYSNTINPYIKAVYTYEEGKCEENDSQGSYSDDCEYSTCLLTGNCPAGTIIDYQVDSDTTNNTTNYAGSTGILRFHVLYNQDNKITMQMNKNLQSLNGTPWYSGGNDATKGPATILSALEAAANGWINVNNQTYILGTTDFGTGDYATTKVGCTPVKKGSPNAANCNANPDTYIAETIDASLGGLTRTNVKARLITYQEVGETGCKMWDEENTCPKWMINYLNNYNNYETFYSTELSGNHGYWTSSARSDYTTHAWFVRNLGYMHRYDTSFTNLGARPVVVVNKFE